MGENIFFKVLGIILIIILLITSIFEILFLVFIYRNSDKAECNLFWCVFTSKSSFENISIQINQSSLTECYYSINGSKVNCSDVGGIIIS